MTLIEKKINRNPYLKVSNFTDISDIEYAMVEMRKLETQYGDNNKTLLNLWAKILAKKNNLNK